MSDMANKVRGYADDICCTDGGSCRTLYEAADYIEQLEAIVDRLPKTADGVQVVPGDRVFDLLGDIREVSFDDLRKKFWVPVSRRDPRRLPESQQWITGVLKVLNCYSTKEAAEVAQRRHLHEWASRQADKT